MITYDPHDLTFPALQVRFYYAPHAVPNFADSDFYFSLFCSGLVSFVILVDGILTSVVVISALIAVHLPDQIAQYFSF